MKEIWLPIKGYEGLYEISNKGRVKSLPKICKNGFKRGEKILKASKNKVGYLVVKLFLNKGKLTMTVHRLMAIAFIANPENKPQVLHEDKTRTNNKIENLRWATNSERMQHAYA